MKGKPPEVNITLKCEREVERSRNKTESLKKEEQKLHDENKTGRRRKTDWWDKGD